MDWRARTVRADRPCVGDNKVRCLTPATLLSAGVHLTTGAMPSRMHQNLRWINRFVLSFMRRDFEGLRHGLDSGKHVRDGRR